VAECIVDIVICVNFFPGHAKSWTCKAPPISVFVALYSKIKGLVHCVMCRFTPQLLPVPNFTALVGHIDGRRVVTQPNHDWKLNL